MKRLKTFLAAGIVATFAAGLMVAPIVLDVIDLFWWLRKYP